MHVRATGGGLPRNVGCMHSFYRNGKHVGFLAGLHGSQRSFPNSYFLPPRLAESVLEPILQQRPSLSQHSANFTPNIPHPLPFNAYLHFLEPKRHIPASAQRKELSFVRLLGSQRGERNFSCTEVQISTYLRSTLQILENLFIYFRSDSVKHFRIWDKL